MPLFMDLHIVPGITARGVAEAHLMDIKIQEEFHCSCMTYWIDEPKNSAFCLIEAPTKNAVNELHKKSHGLLPYNIIEVNKETVSAFLGRLYDPEVPGTAREEIKVFNDPAYRCFVFLAIQDPIIIKSRIPPEKGRELLSHYFSIVEEYSKRSGGEIIEYSGQVSTLLCFSNSLKAISCALKIINAFTKSEKEILGIKISVNAGMPVTSGEKIFEETIKVGERLLYVSNVQTLVLGTNIKSIDRDNHVDKGNIKIFSISPVDEKLLNKIFNVLEHHSHKENFGIDDFCREAGLSKSSLNRHIQALTSRSPNFMIKDYRLNKALHLLKKRESISNVAFLTGFRSPSYFSKCFKEHFAFSPSYYLEHIKSHYA